MTEKIYQSYSWDEVFVISDEQWRALETASRLKFSEDHRRSIESAVGEYVVQRGALSRAASPRAVRDALERIRELATNLYLEMTLLAFSDVPHVVQGMPEDYLNLEARVRGYIGKKYNKKGEAVPTGDLGRAVLDVIEKAALRVGEDRHLLHEFKGDLLSIVSVLDVASQGICTDGGHPGDRFLNEMLEGVSDVLCQAGGGVGYSISAKEFWEELRTVISRHFEKNSGDAKAAIPALTEAAIRTRLTKIQSAKRGAKST